ncbi:MAG TPA: ATP-binding cassette domain-containing protein [Flavobacteriales bacterium]|nr:ATP-binding cassette domain-containing protein [Flavobacteriales bacterium]
MIEILKLNKTFHLGSERQVIAVQNLDISFENGSFNLLIGSNGSGKSTLLNLIAGTILPDSGTISINGKPIQSIPSYKRSTSIARIFQDPTAGTAPDLSLLDNFRLASLRTQKKGLRIGVDAAFRKVVAAHVSILDMGLENRLNQPMGSFSGGQRQALTLLMATFDKLDVLLLDEPTAALDPKSAVRILELTQRIVAEKKIIAIMVTHELRQCIQVGTRIIQLSEGQIIRDVAGNTKTQLRLEELANWFA